MSASAAQEARRTLFATGRETPADLHRRLLCHAVIMRDHALGGKDNEARQRDFAAALADICIGVARTQI